MIGKVVIGKSFRGCLLYCLHDKQRNREQAVMKDRAEVLLYNKCYGSDKELIQQFHEVRLLNQKVSKPVLHITLSLAPGEQLGKDKLMEIAEGCAKDMGFQNNQYVAISHRDTNHQHLHIVANRIGFDGRTVSDSNSYKKVALFCRKMELKYGLKQVLSPKRYLAGEQRQLPRLNQRREKLKEHIKQSLITSSSYSHFEEKMKALGYQVLKSRGISFLDDKGVKVKGSEVGYSLMRIEQTLAHKAVMQHENKSFQPVEIASENRGGNLLQNGKDQHRQKGEAVQEKQQDNSLSRGLEVLLASEKREEALSPELLRRKRKRKKKSLNL